MADADKPAGPVALLASALRDAGFLVDAGDPKLEVHLAKGKIEIWNAYGCELQCTYTDVAGERTDLIDIAKAMGMQTLFQYRKETLPAVIDQIVQVTKYASQNL
ncbi:MAG: hypothetical protein ABUS57_07610 [Pseudomonadota bacterium]